MIYLVRLDRRKPGCAVGRLMKPRLSSVSVYLPFFGTTVKVLAAKDAGIGMPMLEAEELDLYFLMAVPAVMEEYRG